MGAPFKYPTTLNMKMKQKGGIDAASIALSKKGRPTKAYCIEDAVQMVSLFDEWRI